MVLIIPAIDLRSGSCVRLEQGEMSRVTVFSTVPVQVAQRWVSLGATMLHVVDLEGAMNGVPHNEEVIAQIVSMCKVPIQVGGGIRDLKTIEYYLGLGVARVVLGTVAYTHPALLDEACRAFPDQIVVSLDARQGMVAIRGWKETTPERAVALLKRLEDKGVAAVIFTDIMRDGMMVGPNLESIRELATVASIPLIASGGITTLDQVRALMKLEKQGVVGVILGRALYEGRIDLREAIKLSRDVEGR